MADFHTLIEKAEPGWPAEWRFRFAEFARMAMAMNQDRLTNKAVGEAASNFEDSTTKKCSRQVLPGGLI
jgi:hypothetical protein